MWRKRLTKVTRFKIWESLRNINVNSKLIRVIKYLYKRSKSSVISKNMMSKMFDINTGVSQGGTLP